eukprot:TRINITY_DN15016_c0_g1_i1.p1 TRINITY_DN15016_c0_g1~~TRINITY_DN15016_c0_g1_i1.p1  ORF type:complete len:228 (+),score=51.22 TRINITY_DN15016_c0_g1_i1:32-715(+)
MMNSAEQQLRMVVEKHKEHIKEIDVCIQMCTELGMQLAEAATPAEQMSKLEDQVVSYVKMEHEMQAHIAALNEVILELQRNRDLDATEEFKKRVATHAKAQVDPKTHPKYRSFLETTWKAAHPDEPFPGENEDEDIQFLSQQGELLDPLTRAPYVRPMKNSCGHTYSYDSIMTHIHKSRKRDVKCPVAGCRSMVSEATLQRDVEMERKMKKRELQSQDNDNDDVVDL